MTDSKAVHPFFFFFFFLPIEGADFNRFDSSQLAISHMVLVLGGRLRSSAASHPSQTGQIYCQFPFYAEI